jgi:rSAM/selenodomain-associated transferase 1
MPTLLVFLKYPVAGRVKTRLAASIGPERAATLYRQWIGLVFSRLQPLRDRVRIVACYDEAPRHAFALWEPFADEWRPQSAGSLGRRLHDAFEMAHTRGGPVVAIGTDCLELDAPAIQEALDLLAEKDVVFGPATDGGYYLVGNAKPLQGFFQGIPWSSPETLAAHLSLCRDRGWSVGLLPARRDIDTWEDWLFHCRVHEGTHEETCP